MFNRSARDNILYGRPDASEEEMIAAARKAEAHEFILDLQDHKGRRGYDAHLGERGVKLSGGQRQRIALARAILKDAPILVLDEATSALDSEVEAAIQSALERVMEGKTVLAIAHRLSTLREMDRIVVLDRGRIVEAGSHEELAGAGRALCPVLAAAVGRFPRPQGGGIETAIGLAARRRRRYGEGMTEYTITRLGHHGDGIAEGPVFAAMTLPGEVVTGTLTGSTLQRCKDRHAV